MARFGRFETVRELNRTGLTVVYSAQEAGKSDGGAAVKVFEPPAFVLDDDWAKSESLRYLDSARVQQKVASGSTEHWAPVYEYGATANGGFYATDRYDRSLRQLIDGRIKLSSTVLHAIIEPIAKGLMELKQQCGRPHGNLKAANVLIAGPGEISRTKIVLSDPLSDERIDSEAWWNRDLRAVAEFIYELVTHRPMPAVEGWRVPESAEWNKLGRQAGAWRSLCNLLLSASAGPETVTIETVVAKLDEIKDAASSLRTRRLIAAGAVLVACVAVVIVLVRRPPPPPSEAEWAALCNTYEAWIDGLRKGSNDEVIRDRWGRVEKLQELLGNIETASYPYEVMQKEGTFNIRDIMDPNDKDGNRTRKALAAIRQIGNILDPNSPDAWPLLSEMADAESRFRDLGWIQSAAYLANLVKNANPGPNKAIFDSIDMILEIGSKDINDIDWKTFDADHRDNSTEGRTEPAFTYTPGIIKEYYRLHPDPRQAISELVKKTEGYIEEALVSNPEEANACVEALAEWRPKIDGIRKISPIVKNETEIRQKIDQYRPQLDELLRRADRARELPRDYVKRIRGETVSTAKADKLNETWITLRDKLLAAYPLSMLEQNLESYAELRQKMDRTYGNLSVLDRELEIRLPLQVGIDAGDSGWKQALIQVYALERDDRISGVIERIPVKNDTPDVNDGTFKDFRTAQFSEFAGWRADLVGLVTAFDTIQDAMELCYLLDDEMPNGALNIRSVWQKWKDASILKDSRVREPVTDLVAGITRLEQIEQSSDPQELVPIALDTNVESETAYAAWIRLGRLPDISWPGRYEDLTQDRDMRDRLRNDFEIIRGMNEKRADHLLTVLTGRGLKHEIAFVERNRFEDKALGRLVKYAGEMNCSDFRSECEKIESSARDISDFVAGEDWQTDKIEKTLFSDESNVHNSGTAVTTETFGRWLAEVKDYRKLESDPRNDSRYAWDEAISKIDTEIRNELGRKPEGDYLAKLQDLKSDFDDAMLRISNMRQLPLIEKHRGEITKSRDYWEELRGIERKLKPEYCGRLDVDNGRLIFAANSLGPNFEPVDAEKKNSVVLPAGWELIREAVKNKQRQWLDFFYTIDGNDVANVGWPIYVRSTKDPTVVLTFIPAGPGNSEPFYMGTKETTNRRYLLFLEKYGAVRGNPKLPGWSIITDQANNKLIQCTVTNTPPTAIQWDKSSGSFSVAEAEADLPVTWVTFYGAQAYCAWFGGRLPSVSEHKYACTAETGDVRPWGNNTSEIGSYAHVRGPAWRNAANQWNRNKDSKVPPLPVKPVGAIEDYLDRENRILDPNAIVVTNDVSNSVWPVAGAAKANAWDLYDMIGNVWEWCQDDLDDTKAVICGGSCVAPPKHILLESDADYAVNADDFGAEFQRKSDIRANDIGFRVIVPAK